MSAFLYQERNMDSSRMSDNVTTNESTEVLYSPDWAPSPPHMQTGLILDNFTKVSGFAECLETNAPQRRSLEPSCFNSRDYIRFFR